MEFGVLNWPRYLGPNMMGVELSWADSLYKYTLKTLDSILLGSEKVLPVYHEWSFFRIFNKKIILYSWHVFSYRVYHFYEFESAAYQCVRNLRTLLFSLDANSIQLILLWKPESAFTCSTARCLLVPRRATIRALSCHVVARARIYRARHVTKPTFVEARVTPRAKTAICKNNNKMFYETAKNTMRCKKYSRLCLNC